MERLNGEGILPGQLLLALRDRRLVATARRINRCLLCRKAGVIECGLCDACYGQLQGEAAELATRWLAGVGP